jgi:hypothetical protein
VSWAIQSFIYNQLTKWAFDYFWRLRVCGGGGRYVIILKRYEGWLSDVWSFDFTATQWTWIGGSDVLNLPPVFGTKGVAQPDGRPAVGGGMPAIYHPLTDQFMLFSGFYAQENGTFIVFGLN